MTALTREEENRKLAEWLEPLSSVGALPHKCPPTCAADHNEFPDISPKHIWILRSRPEWHWAPPNFFHSEEASALLLDRIVEESRAIYFHETWADAFTEAAGLIASFARKHNIPDRKTAIALAALSLIEKESHD